MSEVSLPAPTRRPPRRNTGSGTDGLEADGLERDLRAAVDGEVRFDAGSRSAFSTDASNYRQVPIGVVVPHTVEAAVAAVEVCRRHGAPLLSRGGGTSLGGQCVNHAVVIDWSKYCNSLVSLDVDRATCIVEPGMVLDHLNSQLRSHDLEFGPRPATHSHCTIGGMIGNNSCGATAQRTGKVVDNVVRLEVLLHDGTRMWVGAADDEEYATIVAAGGRRAEIYRQLRTLGEEYRDEIRDRYPDIPRRVSGYNLDSLLPEREFDVARALVGSEGTLVTILHAELRLVPIVAARSVLLLGYDDVVAAATAVPDVLTADPIALEGLDHQLIGFERDEHLNSKGLELLPEGRAFLLVELGGRDQNEADEQARQLLAKIGRGRGDDDVMVVDDPSDADKLWAVRESALGATARAPGMADTWPGWEDSAVAPEDLGNYLTDLRSLLDEFGYGEATLYGHFGQGCVHSRIPFDLRTADGVAAFRSFLERAADLVTSYGGSLSGEHGDGQARGELLARMFGEGIVTAFTRMKAIFDPLDKMNPGKVVSPGGLDDNLRLDENLRLGTDFRHTTGSTAFGYTDDAGNFGRAVLRCVGVGKCRRETGGVMCPSYMVTRDEEHSTRGRARLLFEMLDGGERGGAITDGWRSTAVRDALDLCLGCKGCKSDCPVNVDMATYKAEFLWHHHAHRIRPAAHYSMGWLPLWSALASRAPRTVNRLTHTPGVARVAKRLAGVDRRRDVPMFAGETLQQWFARRQPSGDASSVAAAGGRRGSVLLWPDTFSNHFHPSVGRAAVEVLEDAGWRVSMPEQPVCCGLTWISTGQLGMAKRVLRRTLAVLGDHIRAGGLVVGLEPSCTAVFRGDLHDLLPTDDDAARLGDQTVTLAELLHDHSPQWQAPKVDRKVMVQTHCHQHAILGDRADRAVLAATGADVDVLDSGCCGLAGNFGFERGHYDVSVACAERVLLPAVRDAAGTDVILADGFSCRTQIHQGDSGGREAMHLAELLRAAGHGELS